MHQFMQTEEFKIKEEKLSNSQSKAIDNQNIVQMNAAKFEKEFCKKLPESLEVLSNILYSEEEITESPG